MTGDWRDFRPAIWLAMIGVAAFALLNVLVGVAVLGAAAGLGLRIRFQRRRRITAAKSAGATSGRRKSRGGGARR